MQLWPLFLAARPSLAAPYSSAPEPPRTELSHPCSRQVSRWVKVQIEKELLSSANRSGVQLWPDACPFDTSQDIYAAQERSKKRGPWICGVCGKTFVNDHYLDLHLERRHADMLPSGGVCLADYCESFGACEDDPASSQRRSKRRQKPDCNTRGLHEIDKARDKCDSAMERCFPLDNEETRRLFAQNSKRWCLLALDCKVRQERWEQFQGEALPLDVLLIFIGLACSFVFCIMVCFVDYFDDIVEYTNGTTRTTRTSACNLRESPTRSKAIKQI